MAVINKKCWPEFFEEVRSGRKKFEVRLADVDINPGDTLVLEEWDPGTKTYSGRKLEKKVSLVYKTKNFSFWDKEEIDKYGYLVVGFE